MVTAHKYILEPYKGMNTRYHCPSCQQREKTFSRYIDTETGEHIHPTVGRCNRESNCGYHYTPKQYFQDNNISFDTPQPKANKPRPATPQPKPVSFIPVEVFKSSLKGYENNHFVSYLFELFGAEIASQLVSRYFIATSKYWNGATVFWQIDTNYKVRTGKIMLYSPSTGKRVKEPYQHIQWVHKELKLPNFNHKQCFFGEHLLLDRNLPVAIVESEKTAVIASVYFPEFIWLATGGLDGLNFEKCSILRGRNVRLYPDLNGFEKWSKRAKEFSQIANFTISDLLERKAPTTERTAGLDLADYLIRFDYKEFTLIKNKPIEQPPVINPLVEVRELIQPETPSYLRKSKPLAESWEHEISELKSHFSRVNLPPSTFELNQFSTITDCPLFLKVHFDTVRANNGNPTYRPYLNRLHELKAVLNNIPK